MTTYAGFEGESDLLWQLYLLAVGPEEHPHGQGVKIHPTLPIYANAAARTVAYWDHEARAPWKTAAYLAAQRATLRPSTYLRLHENRWSTGTEAFITGELWDGCVVPTLRPIIGHSPSPMFVGVDAGIKHDFAAVVAVRWEGQQLVLCAHRIWRPTANDPLDIEATIEVYLRALHGRGNLRAIVCDPYQLHRSITTLKQAGLPIREYPQTTANLTAAGQSLFDLLNGRNLQLYASPELRQQALLTIAAESSRGWRIAKEKSSHKIDAIVALAMACREATERGPSNCWIGPMQSVGGAHGPYSLQSNRPIDWPDAVTPDERKDPTWVEIARRHGRPELERILRERGRMPRLTAD